MKYSINKELTKNNFLHTGIKIYNRSILLCCHLSLEGMRIPSPDSITGVQLPTQLIPGWALALHVKVYKPHNINEKVISSYILMT